MLLKYIGTDFTQYVSSFVWSGSVEQACRTATISVINNPLDTNIKPFRMANGKPVSIYTNGGKPIYTGKVVKRPTSNQPGTVDYETKDNMDYLLRDTGTFKFKKHTPEFIVKQICHAAGITPGSIARTKVTIKKLYLNERSFYESIMAAYAMAMKKNGKKYYPRIDGTKLDIVELGELVPNFCLYEDERITEATYDENTDEVVNKVVVRNNKGKIVGTVKDKASISKYGTYQQALTVEKGKGTKEAKAAIHGTTKDCTVEAIGDLRCIAGKAIMIKDTGSGLVGKFYIKHDEHTFENGTHMMNLELSFSNVMETYSADSQSKSSGSSSSATDKAENIVDYSKTFIGKVKYVFGAASPQKGYSDCSGYTQYVYKHAAGKDIGRTCDTQYQKGKVVKKSKLQAGDLVVFHDTYQTNTPHGPSHCGIMVDHKRFINCHSTGVDICSLNQAYWSAHYLGARRIV